MARVSFVGGSYQSASPNADCEYSQNWMPEVIESGVGTSAMVLYPSPGTAVFSALTNMRKVLTGLYFGTRAFVVAQDLSYQYLWEIFDNNVAPINRGRVGFIGGPASMVANNANQLLVCSNGTLWYFNLLTNVLVQLDTTSGSVLIGPVAKIQFSDGFFIALIANSQTIQVSALLNGAASGWTPLDFTIVSVFPDQVLSMLVDHREVWLFGPKQTIPYFDAGAPIFPYLPAPGGFIEQGIIAPQSPVKLDNTVMWIGGDDRGYGVAWRANGYLPTRISNHALETQWQSFPTCTDAIGYTFQDRGHSIAHWYFPSANKSFRYDVATGLWHNPTYNLKGLPIAHNSQCHFMAFNKHLVGGALDGNVYEMSPKYLTDNGTPIQRVRRGAPVASEQEYMHLHRLQVYLESGLGPIPPLTDAQGNPRDPELYYRDSRDGGHEWSDPITLECGQAGQYSKRVQLRRLGRARSYVPEISVTDPIAWNIIDFYLDAPGAQMTSQQRLPKRIAQIA